MEAFAKALSAARQDGMYVMVHEAVELPGGSGVLWSRTTRARYR